MFASLFFALPVARANSDPLVGVVGSPGGTGLGAAIRVEQSPYQGGGSRYDLVPLYLYEGKHLYLHAYRFGIKVDSSERSRFDVFLSHRFEGFPHDRVPASLAGMANRESGLDVGASYERRGDWGAAYAEFLHDVSSGSGGNELRLGYRYDWRSGNLTLRPYATLAWRDANLNNYYYGVRPDEATPLRPAYAPGSGLNQELGLYGMYSISAGWRLLAGVGVTRWSKGVTDSPIVDGRYRPQAVIGLMYDFSPETTPWPENRHLLMRAYAGRATNCDVAKTMRFACTSTQTQDQTRVAAFEVGRTFVEGLNAWPIDIAGFVGLMRHDENGAQPDFWQLNAYLRGQFYGFPWSDTVKTRIGLGFGVSYAQRASMLELRDQQANGRSLSKLLNYLDPTIDVSLGDLLRLRSLKETFIGFGVSHRSGIFGTSQLLGNVNGGSNYIYSYLEWEL